jgi:hypothetical protein
MFSAFLIFFFTVSGSFAAVYALKTGPESFTYFTAPEPGSEAANVYYRRGGETAGSRVVTTGYLRIGLDKGIDPHAFAQTHALHPAAEVHPGVWLFENRSGEGDVELCAKLWEQAGVLFAVPRFESRKRLQ